MSTSVRPSWVLPAILFLGMAREPIAADQSSVRSSRQIQVAVVAERADPGAPFILPTPDDPASFVACDAGYVHEGNSSTNEQPPSALPIARTLQEILGAQHYRSATAPAVPSLLVIYHWGLVNRNAHQSRTLSGIDSNLKARLALVATTEQAGEIENFLLSRSQGRTNPAYQIPENLSVQARGILDLTRNSRWFVVVSAYDYASFARHESKLLWRVKMSTDQRSGLTMAEALPALLRAGGPSFGRNVEAPRILPVPLFPADVGAVATSIPEEFLRSPEVEKRVDHTDLGNLIQQERAEFSWIHTAHTRADDDGPPH